MKLIVLASGSKGNCYILTNGNEALVIEAGIRFLEVKKALDFNLSIISGALVSHRHGDHAKYVDSFIKAGIDVISSEDVFKAKEIESVHAKVIKKDRGYKLGRFSILPFPLNHDVPCYGFYIKHPEIGNMVFITDTYMCKYTFPKLNHILVEANYSDEILEQNVNAGSVNKFMKNRLLYSHCEIKTTLGIIEANDLTDVRNIVLLHLSDRNSNGIQFKNRVAMATGIPVYIASKNLELEL